MGRGEKELLAAAAENDYAYMIVSGLIQRLFPFEVTRNQALIGGQDLLSQKVKPTIKDTLKASILGKKRSQDPVRMKH